MFNADWRNPFINSRFRLRFELGGETFANIEQPVPRFARAFDRARELAAATFAPTDACFAVICDWSGTGSDELGALGLLPSEPVAAWSAAPFPDDPDCPVAAWRAIDITHDAVARDTLIWASITAEMPIQPTANALIYLVSRAPEICFHVYDDRGLDIVALDATDLNGVRSRYDEWILEYDRRRIASAFDE